MPRPNGVLISTGANGTFVCDTITCCHCGLPFSLPVKADPNNDFGFCRSCMKPTCTKPACNARCLPTEKWLEQQERAINNSIERDRQLRGFPG